MFEARWRMAYPGIQGDWLEGKECPPGHVVHGMKLRLLRTMEEKLGLLRIKKATMLREHESGAFEASKCVDGLTTHNPDVHHTALFGTLSRSSTVVYLHWRFSTVKHEKKNHSVCKMFQIL